jgi:ribokinase
LIGSSFAILPGGKGANQAVASARLGAKTVFAGCVGDDAFGKLQRESLSREGIDLTHLKMHSSAPTGTAMILVAEEGQNSIVVTPGANFGVTPDDIEKLQPLFSQVEAVLLQLEIPIESVAAALEMGKQSRVLTVLDCGPAQRVPAAVIEAAGIVSPNETEAEALTGTPIDSLESARVAAQHLIETGAKEVVLKLGPEGALYMSATEWFHVPAFKVDPVDTVAAGDAFTAALAIQWLRKPKPDAIRYANAAGALATMSSGAQPAMPGADAVETFLRERGH